MQIIVTATAPPPDIEIRMHFHDGAVYIVDPNEEFRKLYTVKGDSLEYTAHVVGRQQYDIKKLVICVDDDSWEEYLPKDVDPNQDVEIHLDGSSRGTWLLRSAALRAEKNADRMRTWDEQKAKQSKLRNLLDSARNCGQKR